jgi:lysophospholipase L1-like esterase
MKNVLCFGDSNTYGSKASGGRFERDRRWTGILQKLLGDQYYVIEEGCGGRTTVFDDPIEEYKNGKKYLLPCLHSHWPLDLVIIMLGTNDLKNRFVLSPMDVQCGMENLIMAIQNMDRQVYGKAPEILIMAPVQIGRLTALEQILIGAKEKCEKLPALYMKLAKTRGTHYLNAGDYAAADDMDGVHIDEAGHSALAAAVADKVRQILEGSDRLA